MFFRALSLAILFSSLAAFAQVGDKESNKQQSPSAACPAGRCVTGNHFDSPPNPGSLPSTPVQGKWRTEEFKATDASVSCSVVKYDSTVTRPILHLLCPGRNVFAPLRVHLALTWKDVAQIPAAMRSMLVDMNSVVKFKSNKAGDSRAELTLQDPNASRYFKQWISFTEVNVGLVLPSK